MAEQLEATEWTCEDCPTISTSDPSPLFSTHCGAQDATILKDISPSVISFSDAFSILEYKKAFAQQTVKKLACALGFAPCESYWYRNGKCMQISTLLAVIHWAS